MYEHDQNDEGPACLRARFEQLELGGRTIVGSLAEGGSAPEDALNDWLRPEVQIEASKT